MICEPATFDADVKASWYGLTPPERDCYRSGGWLFPATETQRSPRLLVKSAERIREKGRAA